MKVAMRMAGAIVAGLFLALAACKDVPGADGRYATPSRGGWDNFRAQSPASGPPPAIAELTAAISAAIACGYPKAAGMARV